MSLILQNHSLKHSSKRITAFTSLYKKTIRVQTKFVKPCMRMPVGSYTKNPTGIFCFTKLLSHFSKRINPFTKSLGKIVEQLGDSKITQAGRKNPVSFCYCDFTKLKELKLMVCRPLQFKPTLGVDCIE